MGMMAAQRSQRATPVMSSNGSNAAMAGAVAGARGGV